jgi:hypothetical protein
MKQAHSDALHEADHSEGLRNCEPGTTPDEKLVEEMVK